MSNLLTPVAPHILEAVTGGQRTPSSSSTTGAKPLNTGSGSNDLLQILTSLSNTIKDISSAANKSGFSTTEILMLGFMLQQQRNPVNVFVRAPYW